MKKLAGVVSEIIIDEYGTNEYLKRLADPYFFQAFGCILGFDWHSSGLTTTVCSALKEEINESNFGVMAAGGKGKYSRKTLQEIETSDLSTTKIERLKYASRITAKVDNNLIQDSYQLYHHSFIFTEKGKWCVVQQGMNVVNRYARRYHWLSENVSDFVDEPHNAICGVRKESNVLDMTAKDSEESRKTSVDLVKDNPKHLIKYANKYVNPTQTTLTNFASFALTRKHSLYVSDLNKRTIESLKKAYEIQPANYEELVALRGIGPKSVRALALISELVYGAKVSWKDPAKYSWAFGGKDGYPRPVERKLMDSNTLFLKDAIKQAKLNNKEKLNAIVRLNQFI